MIATGGQSHLVLLLLHAWDVIEITIVDRILWECKEVLNDPQIIQYSGAALYFYATLD
jgi:hypothetical protein